MFPWKPITQIPILTFEKSSEKVGVAILVIDFQENICMSSDGFPNLLNKFLFNLRRQSTLYSLPFQSYEQSKMSKNVTVWQNMCVCYHKSWETKFLLILIRIRSKGIFLPKVFFEINSFPSQSILGAASATSRFDVELIVFMAIMLHKVIIIFSSKEF